MRLSLVTLSSLKMGLATLASRILGLVREQVIAAVFGASALTDAFLVAFRIPNMLRDLLAEGAFSSAFIPTFSKVRHQSEEEAKRLLWSMTVLLLIITVVIAILIIIFADPLVHLFAPKFAENPELFRITVDLLRLLSPFLTLVSLAALFMGVLNTLKLFFMPALAPALFNVMMILSVIFMPRFLVPMGINKVFAMGFGAILGGIAQMMLQVPFLFKKGYGPVGPIKLLSPQTKTILNRIGIGTIGVAATDINVLISTILATGTVAGAVSWLNYAFRLFQFPVGILGVSIASSNLVHFSDALKSDKKDEAAKILQQSYNLCLMTMLPATALLWALSYESVNLVLQRGAFTAHDTMMTTLALNFYLLGLPFYGLYKILSPTFYALDKPRIPVTLSVCAIGINIIFCLSTTPFWGFKVLALGTSITMLLNTGAQAFFLTRLLKLRATFFLNRALIKYSLFSLLVYGLSEFLSSKLFHVEEHFAIKAIAFTIICVAAISLYGLLLVISGDKANLLARFKRNRK